jgi:hypothetical protein
MVTVPRSPAMRLALAALVLLLPAAEEGIPVLAVNPLRKGFEGWTQTGSEKAFAWNAADSTLVVKGQSGKEPPRLVYGRIAWDAGAIRFQAKKGARKLRVLLQPAAGGAAIPVDVPSSAVKSTPWTDLGVALRGDRAVLLAPGADGKEAEAATVPLPAAGAFRFGFEAPSGADAVLTGIRLERAYEDTPPIVEEGFESLFDGKSLGAWRPMRPKDAPLFSAEQGLIQGIAHADDGWLTYGARPYAAYELRMRACWGTNALMIRAVEVPGSDGMINKLDTVQLNLGDHVDPENLNEITVRVADGTCSMIVNGKKVLDAKVKPFESTFISFYVPPGKKFLLRDIRIRDLAQNDGK